VYRLATTSRVGHFGSFLGTLLWDHQVLSWTPIRQIGVADMPLSHDRVELYNHALIITSSDGKRFGLSVCLLVCPLDYSKSYERTLVQFLAGCGVGKAQRYRSAETDGCRSLCRIFLWGFSATSKWYLLPPSPPLLTVSKARFIATQLNSTRRRVELSCVVEVYKATQLN